MNAAPYKQIKRSELDEKSKTKIPLKHAINRDAIKTRKVEVMPLPSSNYEHLRVKQIDLKESLELQKQQVKKIKEAQMKHAIDKLLGVSSEPVDYKMTDFEGTSAEKMAYRDKPQDDSDHEADDNAEENHTIAQEDSDDDPQ